MENIQVAVYFESLSSIFYGLLLLFLGRIVLKFEELISYINYLRGNDINRNEITPPASHQGIIRIKNAIGYLLMAIGIITILLAIYTAIYLQGRFNLFDR